MATYIGNDSNSDNTTTGAGGTHLGNALPFDDSGDDEILGYGLPDPFLGLAGVSQSFSGNFGLPDDTAGGDADDGDTLQGGAGNDSIYGGAGNDELQGDSGGDSLFGGDGDDLFIWNNGDGSDSIVGGADNDRVQINGADDAVNGEIFTVTESAGDVLFDRTNLTPFTLTIDEVEELELNGGLGNDSLSITGDFSGTDISTSTFQFSGEDGDDMLDASGLTSAHNVAATGGAGEDSLGGGEGDDSLDGGADNDFLEGSDGNDSLDGGGGDDTAVFTGNALDYAINDLGGGVIEVVDGIGNRDDTDLLINVEFLQFADGTIGTSPSGPVKVFDASDNFVADFFTIQDGVDAAFDDFSVVVDPGTYNENVTIDGKSISLLSTGGRDVTTITGDNSFGAERGTIFVLGTTDGLEIGAAGQGFTIEGFTDLSLPGQEYAAIRFEGASHTNGSIVDNEVVAGGASGITTNFNMPFSNYVITDNEFSGTAFDPNEPIGVGNQFEVPNVPRQLVVISGGSGVTNTSNITFEDNVVSGTAGGTVLAGESITVDTDPGPGVTLAVIAAAVDTPFGNQLASLDVNGGSIANNDFTGFTSVENFNFALRARGPNTDVSDNTFDHTTGGNSLGFTDGGGSPVGQTFSGNQFIGDTDADAFFATPGDDSMTGDDDDDFLFGGAGNDDIDAGSGNDSVDGGDGDDSIDAGSGNDTVDGGAGGDTLRGGDGDDELDGDAENDRLFGDSGGDTMTGGDGDDRMFGGSGGDTVNGGSGNDFMRGGDGDDRFLFDGGDGDDVVTTFKAGSGTPDVLDYSSQGITFGDLSIADNGMGNAVVTNNADGGSTVTLVGVSSGDLDPTDDFAF